MEKIEGPEYSRIRKKTAPLRLLPEGGTYGPLMIKTSLTRGLVGRRNLEVLKNPLGRATATLSQDIRGLNGGLCLMPLW